MKRVTKSIIFVLILAVGGYFITGAVASQLGCPPVSYTPQTAYDIQWDAQNEAVTVRHAGGDAIGPNDDQGTVALFVTITYADTGVEERVTWVNESTGGQAVKEGDTLRIAQSSTDGALSPGDRVRVWWRGDIGHPQPFWCFNQGVGNHLMADQNISVATPTATP